tara:strand:+ start:659 stop:1738 length:1080 start_codon:yes stop_codon:yes gene_type:complete
MKYLLILLFFSTISHSQEQIFEVQQIFNDERFPNILVAKNGNIIATWGSTNLICRISDNGGESWGPVIKIAEGINGGGLIVDENSGDIISFVEDNHPPSKVLSYRSVDNGKTWKKNFIKIYPDQNGNMPSMHMNEHGITIKKGKFKGRLIRPSRYYSAGNDKKYYPEHYSNAIYSDDGGKTWFTSNPFPANGTGEGAIIELGNGNLLYNSRRHFSNDGLNPRMRHIAISKDGGENWNNLSVSEFLPDGQKNSDYGLMAGLDIFNYRDEEIIVYTNIDSYDNRSNGMIWASTDQGNTWPIKKKIDEFGFKYSSIAIGRKNTKTEGMIYILYETGKEKNINEYGGGKIARFNYSWLLNNDN